MVFISLFIALPLCACGEKNEETASSAPESLNETTAYENAVALIGEKKYEDAYTLLYKMRHDEKSAELLKRFKTEYTTFSEVRENGAVADYTYEYNDKGALVRESHNSVSNNGKRYHETIEYTIGENGKPISSKWHQIEGGPEYNTDRETVYTYDDNGNLLKEVITHASGSVTNHRYFYDEKGNLTNKVIVNSDSVQSHTFTYDDKGNITSETIIGAEGDTIKYTYENTYDSDGRLEKVIGKGGETTVFDCVYTYDANGNCITKNYTDAGDNNRVETYSGYIYFYSEAIQNEK